MIKYKVRDMKYKFYDANVLLTDHLIPFILVNVCTGPLGGVPCNGGGPQAPKGTPGPANPAITSRINVPQTTFNKTKVLKNTKCLLTKYQHEKQALNGQSLSSYLYMLEVANENPNRYNNSNIL